MRCLILAGGTGSRLGVRGGLKPLAVVGGLSLVERAIATARAAGGRDFVVVCGHRTTRLVAHLDDIARRRSLVVHPVFNVDYRQGNGLSVLCARELLEAEERFGLLMADHVFEPELLSGLFGADLGWGEVVVAVDSDLSNPLVDYDDVTRVELCGGRVRGIGKGLDPYDGFDTGAFVCTPAVFDALGDSVASGDTSLSGGMGLLAAEGRLRAHNSTGQGWVDVDTRADQRQASRLVYAGLRKRGDGFIARRINRPLSQGVLTPALLWLRQSITANQVSVLALLVGVTAALVFAAGWPLVAGLLVHLSSVLDGSDGEVARLKYLESRFGGYLDAVLDRFADSVMMLGVLVYLLDSSSLGALLGDSRQTLLVVLATVAAIVGNLMVSYTSAKARADVGHHYVGWFVGAGHGRDLRLFILASAALLAAIHPAFLLGGVVLVAVLSYVVIVWRLVWSRNATRVAQPTNLGSLHAIVFDFDGTIADTMGSLSEAAVALLTETYDMSTETAGRSYRETTGMDFASQLERISPGNACNDVLAARFEDQRLELMACCSLFPDTLSVLAELKAMGIALFICSSTPHDVVARFCADTGIAPLTQTVSGLKPGHTKFDQLVATRLQLGVQCDQMLFVGDSLHDFELANRAHIAFTGVTGLFTAEDFARVGAPAVADLAELGALVAAASARRTLLEQPDAGTPHPQTRPLPLAETAPRLAAEVTESAEPLWSHRSKANPLTPGPHGATPSGHSPPARTDPPGDQHS